MAVTDFPDQILRKAAEQVTPGDNSDFYLKTSATPAASEATLLDILAAVDGLEGFTDGIEASLTTLTSKDFSTETTLAALSAKVPSNLTVTSTRLLVDGSGVIQPVSGTVTANQGGTWNITNISGTISLPTGAATSANQTTANASLSSIDTKLTSPIQVQTIAGSAGSTQLETLLYAAKTITTTASLVNVSGSNQTNRILLTIQPTNGTIYVGGDSSVTTSSGTPVESGSFFPMYVTDTCDVYAICASGTVNIRIMEGSDQ